MFNLEMTVKDANNLNNSIFVKNEEDVMAFLDSINSKEQAVAFAELRKEYTRIFDVVLSVVVLQKFARNSDILWGYIGKKNNGSLKYSHTQSRSGGLSDLINVETVQEIVKKHIDLEIIDEIDSLDTAFNKLIKNIHVITNEKRLINDMTAVAHEILKIIQ